MISRIEGKIVLKADKYIVVDVGGVGYKISVSPDTLAKLPKEGSVSLFTHLHVREDALELYGFKEPNELEFFEMLIGISGIGKKMSEKIVLELRDKLSALGHRAEEGELSGELDAVEALRSLGYSQNEARDALKQVSPDLSSVSDRVKQALKIL